MLNDLSITNFAIIDELHVSFDDGLNIISGETGAGKSILIGAVSLLLGDRATADMIRTHADTATVEAQFDIRGQKKLQERLTRMDFPVSDELIIRRVISRTGKNRAQINGQMATLAHLAEVSELLINICGQHEHQQLSDAQNHLDILDEFGGCMAAREEYRTDFDRYTQLLARIGRLEEMRRHRAEKIELILFQLKEMDAVNPQAEEDTRLIEEKKVLANVQKISDWANRCYALLYGDQGSVNERLKDVLMQVREIQKIDAGLKLSAADMESSFVVLQEAALTLRDYAKNLIFDPERLSVVDERLDAINRLKRKHGGSLETVWVRRKQMAEELENVTHVEDELTGLHQEKEALGGELRRKALALSKLRHLAASRLKKTVDAEISGLNMPHASFFVQFLKRAADEGADYGPRGGDEIEFYLTANAGEEPRPLNRIASGGELSRIVLALKNALSRTGSVGTVVFDEVDSGIGGATAEIIGRKLKDVSGSHQVICITHLPQIAVFGGLHLRVSKKVADGRTVTCVEKLDESQKIEEISRMLGGVDLTKTARDHARAMLAAAAAQQKAADSGRSQHAEKSTHR